MTRIGIVSSVDTEKGMARVTFGNDNLTTTDLMPILTFNDEYRMPEVGTNVAVILLDNDIYDGIILGNFWSDVNRPDSAKMYKKTYNGNASLSVDDDGVFTVQAKKIVLKSDNVDIDTTNYNIKAEKTEIKTTTADITKPDVLTIRKRD